MKTSIVERSIRYDVLMGNETIGYLMATRVRRDEGAEAMQFDPVAHYVDRKTGGWKAVSIKDCKTKQQVRAAIVRAYKSRGLR